MPLKTNLSLLIFCSSKLICWSFYPKVSCLTTHTAKFLSTSIVKQVLLHKEICWLMSILQQDFKVYAARWKKKNPHSATVRGFMLAEENYQFGHFQSAVIACVFVNSAMGFLMATAIGTFVLHLMLQDKYVSPQNWPPCRTARGKVKKSCIGSLSIFEKPAAWMSGMAASHPRADMAQCCFLIVESNGVSMRRAERRQSDRRGHLSLFTGGLQPLRLISVWKGKDEIFKQSHGVRKASSFSSERTAILSLYLN